MVAQRGKERGPAFTDPLGRTESLPHCIRSRSTSASLADKRRTPDWSCAAIGSPQTTHFFGSRSEEARTANVRQANGCSIATSYPTAGESPGVEAKSGFMAEDQEARFERAFDEIGGSA